MQATWIQTRMAVTNTATRSLAAISAAAHAATTPVLGLSHRRDVRAGVDTCPVTVLCDCASCREVSR